MYERTVADWTSRTLKFSYALTPAQSNERMTHLLVLLLRGPLPVATHCAPVLLVTLPTVKERVRSAHISHEPLST